MSLGNSDDPEVRREKALQRIKDLNGALYYVKGISGDMIPTESVYAAFIQPLSEFTQNFPDREYINTSLVGAQIDGFKNIPLEEALKDTSPIKDRKLRTDFEYNIPSIKENLFKSKESLQSALYIIEELKKIANSLDNDLKRYKNVTQEILKGLKRLSTGFSALGYDFSKKNKLYDFITTSDRIELDYTMKMTREFTVESVSNVIQKIMNYCNSAEYKIDIISSEINRILGMI